MPGALTGVIKEVYPKRGVIETDHGANSKYHWTVTFDRNADSLQVENLNRRYNRGDRVYFLAAGDAASLVCPKREAFEGTATVDYLQSHHGRGISKTGEVFFTLQRLTHYFKNTAKADLQNLLKLGDKFQYVAVKQPQSTTLKAITVTLPGKEVTRPCGLPTHSRTVSPIQQKEFEGMIIEVAGNHAYVWSLKLGFCFLPRSSCAEMGVTESQSLVEVFVPGDWIRFLVVNQKPKNNCEFRIQKICAAVSHEVAPKIECWRGREPSFNTECFMAKGVGIVGAVPTLEYGILYSEVLGRVYFRSEFIRARTMPKPLIAVQFTAFPDMENGVKDCGWRAIEVAPVPKDMRNACVPKPPRCDGAIVTSCHSNNKSVLLSTKDVGEVFASCQNDFWTRIDDGNQLIGKCFTVFVIPYPHGGNNCQWRALFVCPEDQVEKMFPKIVPHQPMPSPYPFPSPLPIHIPIPLIPSVGVQQQVENRSDGSYMTESQLAALEEELSAIEILPESEHNSEVAEYLSSETNNQPLAESNHFSEHSVSSSGSVSVENGQNVETQNSESTIRFHADSEEGSCVEKGGNQMVDESCQTVPSKERELLKKIMNNKDLFTACMVKFPDLVFEICMTESLLM